MLILNKLWNGELDASGRTVRDHRAYSKILGETAAAEQSLLDVLSPEEKALFERFDNCRGDLSEFLERDAFQTGFRMAGLLLLDVLLGAETQ